MSDIWAAKSEPTKTPKGPDSNSSIQTRPRFQPPHDDFGDDDQGQSLNDFFKIRNFDLWSAKSNSIEKHGFWAGALFGFLILSSHFHTTIYTLLGHEWHFLIKTMPKASGESSRWLRIVSDDTTGRQRDIRSCNPAGVPAAFFVRPHTGGVACSTTVYWL